MICICKLSSLLFLIFVIWFYSIIVIHDLVRGSSFVPLIGTNSMSRNAYIARFVKYLVQRICITCKFAMQFSCFRSRVFLYIMLCLHFLIWTFRNWTTFMAVRSLLPPFLYWCEIVTPYCCIRCTLHTFSVRDGQILVTPTEVSFWVAQVLSLKLKNGLVDSWMVRSVRASASTAEKPSTVTDSVAAHQRNLGHHKDCGGLISWF